MIPFAPPGTARHEALDPVLALADEVLEVRRGRGPPGQPPAGPRPPGTLPPPPPAATAAAPRAAAATALRFPGHMRDFLAVRRVSSFTTRARLISWRTSRWSSPLIPTIDGPCCKAQTALFRPILVLGDPLHDPSDRTAESWKRSKASSSRTRKQDIVSLDMVSGLVVKDGNVGFAIEVDPSAQAPAAGAPAQGCRAGGQGSGRRAFRDRRADRPPQPAARRTTGGSSKEGNRGHSSPSRATASRRGAGARRRDCQPGARHQARSSRSPAARAVSASRPRSRPTWPLALARLGLKVGMLDADIYGPSQPSMLGISGRPSSPDGKTLRPMENYGIKLHVDGLHGGRGHADDLARPDGAERPAADAARCRMG